MTLKEAARAARRAGMEPREARLLLLHVTGLPAQKLLLGEGELSAAQAARLEEAIAQRMEGRPLQYVLGEWEFYGLPMRVDERVLIPRADTETLVERALALAAERRYETALDLCTGSGCIAVCLAKLGGLRATAADISQDALCVAGENARALGQEIAFVRSDLFEAIEGRYDLIASNPPYIALGEYAALQQEVKREPALALLAGEDGLDLYRRIALEAPAHLEPGGTLLLEVGYTQAAEVAALLQVAGFGTIETVRDANGIERVVQAQK